MENPEQRPVDLSRIDLPVQDPLQELITTLMRGKWVILIYFLAALSITAAYTFLVKPVYEATSMVLVDEKGRAGSLPFLDITGNTDTKIINELEILRARSTTDAVAQALLYAGYLDSTKRELIPIIKKRVGGEPVNVKDNIPAITKRIIKAVSFLPVKESDIIRINVRTNDSLEAALIANTYARVYTERNMSASRGKSRAIREFLQSQMQAKHGALDTAEHSLQAYMRTSGMVSLDAETEKVVRQLSQLEATRDGIELEITSRLKTLTSYKNELAAQEPNVAKALGESNDAYIRLLQEQLAKLEVQRDVVIAQNPELSGEKIYSEKVKEIDTQIGALKQNLQNRTQTYLATLVPGDRTAYAGNDATTGFLSEVKKKIIELQIELDALVARKGALNEVLGDYERQFNQIPEKSIELAKLQRARLSNEKLYLLVEEKYNQAAITETSEFGYVNVIDPASVPDEPVSPKMLTNFLVGAFLGLSLGVGIVIWRARLDDRIKSPEDLMKYGVSPLATIGTMEIGQQRNGKSKAGRPTSRSARFARSLVAYFSPLSAMSEGYRHLRTNVQYYRPDRPTRAVVVTSCGPQEGKSTTACNLAVSFAQGEQRVLLVDADLRRPTVHTLFGLVAEPGLTDVVFGKVLLEEAVYTGVLDNLEILCCGSIPPNPAEILNSQRMRDLIDRAIASYDIVIFDSPPLLAVTDSAILAGIVDSVLIVACAGRTSLSSVKRAAQILQAVGKTPAGLVLNNFDRSKAYGGYQSRYRQDHYSYNYGYTSNGNRNPADVTVSRR